MAVHHPPLLLPMQRLTAELGLLLTFIGAVILFFAAKSATFKGGFWSGESLVRTGDDLWIANEKEVFEADAMRSAAITRRWEPTGWVFIGVGTLLQMIAAWGP
jgi:hypothetical protein